MEPIYSLIKANLGFAATFVVLIIALIVVNKKRMLPILYHILEFLAYLTVCHYLLAGAVAAINYFADATNLGTVHGYTTPWRILEQNFADKALYSPIGLYYAEILLVVVLLYLVIIVRPTNYSGRNRFKGDSERGMKPQRGRGQPRYDRTRANAHRNK